MSTKSLVDLPHDILIHICAHLLPADFLSFIQTCRVLHALALSDYVWHQIKHELPIDLSTSRDGTLYSIPAPELQAITIKSLRVDANWRRPISNVLRVTKFPSPHMVVDMQPLGANWLVTSHRLRSNLIGIYLWRLDQKNPASSPVIRIESENAFCFEAAFVKEGGSTALISVLGASQTDRSKGQLSVYHVDLAGHQTNEASLGIPYLISTRKIEHNAVFYYTQITGTLVAAAVVNLVNQPLHEIILYNLETDGIVVVDSPILSAFDPSRMQFKIYPPHIVIVGVCMHRIKAHIRELPSEIFCTTAGERVHADWAASIVDYETSRIRNAEIYISPEPIYGTPLTSFTVMAAYSPFSATHAGVGNIYRFPVDLSARDLSFSDFKPSFSFNMPSNVSLEPTCLGKTGLRAVWLEHQWSSDGYQLMKGSFPVNLPKTVVSSLIPSDLALPFEPHTCRSLYFEESTGKVWVGVHTGDVFVLQF